MRSTSPTWRTFLVRISMNFSTTRWYAKPSCSIKLSSTDSLYRNFSWRLRSIKSIMTLSLLNPCFTRLVRTLNLHCHYFSLIPNLIRKPMNICNKSSTSILCTMSSLKTTIYLITTSPSCITFVRSTKTLKISLKRL